MWTRLLTNLNNCIVLKCCMIFHIFKTHLSCTFVFVTGACDWGFKMKYKNV